MNGVSSQLAVDMKELTFLYTEVQQGLHIGRHLGSNRPSQTGMTVAASGQDVKDGWTDVLDRHCTETRGWAGESGTALGPARARPGSWVSGALRAHGGLGEGLRLLIQQKQERPPSVGCSCGEAAGMTQQEAVASPGGGDQLQALPWEPAS